MTSLLLTDFYKIGHKFQYPKNTQLVYSNFTARTSRMQNVNHIVFFGLQYFIKKYLIEEFQDNFFSKTKEDVIYEYSRIVKACLGSDLPDYSHIEALHDLGYLPIEIKALPEGSIVPLKVPMLTIVNTIKDEKYSWITNWVESLMSSILWQPITSATIAHEYRKILDFYAEDTGGWAGFVDVQAHDFSFRGMGSLESAITSAMAHLTSFIGSDTIPAILAVEKYYIGNVEDETIGVSVPATEHSVMCAGGDETELLTFKRLITEVYPNGIVSIVSDTWDLWKVLTEYLPALKNEILARQGTLVIRPDSGDPVEIICGIDIPSYVDIEDAKDSIDEEIREIASKACEGSHNCGSSEYEQIVFIQDEQKYYKLTFEVSYDRHDKTYYYVDEVSFKSSELIELTAEQKGVIQLLWDTFGGAINSKGYKQIDSHVGTIYGDSITLDRATQICERLKSKGFASTNIVFGIGSYTYQYNTRDTLGMAMKATYVEIDGQPHNIFKNPITDNGVKKSATGLLQVVKKDNTFILNENVSKEDEEKSELRAVFKNGALLNELSFLEVKAMLKSFTLNTKIAKHE